MPDSPDLIIRRATANDLPAIIAVYADDETGGHGDGWSDAAAPGYRAAFARIAANPENELFVVGGDGHIVATFLLHFFDSITGGGSRHCELKSVSVAAAARGRGVGARIIAVVEERARAGGAKTLHLVSNKRRTDAHRFYEREGYARSHEGFTKKL